MSMAMLLATLAGREQAVFVGFRAGGEDSTTLLLPVGSRAGDYVVANYYSGRSLTGGSGTAFNTITRGDSKASHRKLEAGDLTTPLTLGGNTPYVVGVWRGPQSLSPLRSSVTWTTPNENVVPGFDKDDASLGFVGIGVSGASAVSFKVKDEGGQFDASGIALSSGLGFGMGSLTNLDGYVNGTDLPVEAGTSLTKDAAVYELLYTA